MTKTLMMEVLRRGISSLRTAQAKEPLWRASQRRSSARSRRAVTKRRRMKSSSIRRICSTRAFSRSLNKLTGKTGSTSSQQLPKRPHSLKVNPDHIESLGQADKIKSAMAKLSFEAPEWAKK